MFSMYSQNGRKLIVFEDFKYSRNSLTQRGLKWRCCKKGCAAHLFTDEAGEVLLMANGVHNHKPCPKLLRHYISNAIKRKAREALVEAPMKLVQRELSSAPDVVLNSITRKDMQCVRRNLYTTRRKVVGTDCLVVSDNELPNLFYDKIAGLLPKNSQNAEASSNKQSPTELRTVTPEEEQARSTSVDEVPKAELTVTSHNESSNEMVAEAERDTSSHNFDNANLHSSIEIKEESEVRTELDISESTIKAEPFSPHSQHEEIFNLPSSTPPLSTEFGHHSNFEHKVDILDWSSPAEQYIQTSPNQLHIKDNVRRIVDIGFLFNQLRNISRHKQKNSCTFADMTLINEERNGFMSTFIFECSKCHLKSNIYSDNPSNTNINGDAVAAMNTISGSHSILSDVTNHLKIPPLSRETYYKIKCNSNSEDIPVMTPILETQCGNGVQTSIRERRPQSDHSGNVPFKPNNNQKKRKRITKKTQPPLERDFSEIDSNIVQAGSPHYINPPSTHPQNIETQVKSFPSGQLSLQRTKDPVPLSFGSNMFPQISRECPAAIISSESRSLQTIGRSPDQNLVPEQVPLLRIKDPSSLLSNTSMLSQNALHSGQMCSDSVSLQRLGGLREMPCPPLLITQNYIQPVIPTPAAVRCSENMPYKSENANDLYIKVPTLHDSLQREPMSSDPLTEFPNSTNQEESASDEQFSCASPVHISIPDAKISIKEEMEDHPIGESAYQSCER